MESGTLPRFFDRATRQAFSDLALDDPPVARYLVELLTRFSRADALRVAQAVTARRLETVADSLLAIQSAWDLGSPGFNPAEEPALRRHIGDYTLFMTGIFRDHVDRLAPARTISGRASAPIASSPRRRERAVAPDEALFRRLAERFEQYAGALTYARKVYFRAESWDGSAWPGDPFRGLLSAE